MLLYFFPSMQTAKRQDDVALLTSYRQIEQFVDAVRNKGYITPEMYSEFESELGAYFSGYEIEMEHRHKKYHPEYGDPADSSTFLGQYSVQYDAYYNNTIMEALFPASNQTAAPDQIQDRKYLLSAGDYFDVRVTPAESTASSILNRFLYGNGLKEIQVPLIYGGMVLNEDY
nr:hypothetical protein [Paenibacillus caui]